MKKLLLALALCLAPASAWAQCTGVFPANTVCGATTSAPPKPVAFINFPVKLTVGSTTIANGTTTNILYNNAGILGEYTATSTSTASSVLLRDANQNAFFNNYFANATSTTSAGGTTVLTAASSRYQALTGSASQTYQLPDATTLSLGPLYAFNNNSSGSLIITNAGGTTLYTVPAGGFVQTGPTNISTSNGSWDFHPLPPGTVTWGSGTTGLVMNTALSTTPAISAGTPSATVPAFIPQRGTATTGLGGDSTHLYGIVGGAAAWTSTSSGTTIPNLTATTSFTATGSFTATNLVGLGNLAQSGANTMLGNWTGSTANVAANSMPSCPDTAGNHLNYVSGTGVTCGTTSTAASYVLLATLTASNSATLSDTTNITNTYSSYDIVFTNILPASGGTICELQIHSGGAFKSSGYLATIAYNSGGSTAAVQTTTYIPCSENATGVTAAQPAVNGTIRLYNPSDASTKHPISGQLTYQLGGAAAVLNMSGWWDTAGAIDGFQVLFSAGNIASGTIKIYGIP